MNTQHETLSLEALKTRFLSSLQPEAKAQAQSNKNPLTLYFIGIGGISMYGLAKLSQAAGHRVFGSDREGSKRLAALSQCGITVFPQQKSGQISQVKPDLVIRTAAVADDNPEIQEAKALHLPLIDRGAFLGWFTKAYPHVLNVAGTHGKTTTTAMAAALLKAHEHPCTIHVGAELPVLSGETVQFDPKAQSFLSEACEYANSYLSMRSSTAVILNIDLDHLDFFKDLEALIDSFVSFALNVDETDGKLILPVLGEWLQPFMDRLQEACQQRGRRMPRILFVCIDHEVPYGHRLYFDYEARDVEIKNGLPCFSIYLQGLFFDRVQLRVPGLHNVRNFMMALALVHQNGLKLKRADLHRMLEAFKGAEGRFTLKGQFQGAQLVADYAHHPTATRVTLEAARALPHRHLWVVYQPLTFHRVKALFNDYIEALKPCERVLFYEIYSDRESSTQGMSSRLLADALEAAGTPAEYFNAFEPLKQRLQTLVGENDLVLFLGPEEVRSFADKLAE